MTRVAISQSNYIPWRGYFDLISRVDHFVFFDEVQFTRRDWRNRNKLVGSNGEFWMTIPVKTKGNYSQSIKRIEIGAENWHEKHWRSIETTYGRSKFFSQHCDFLRRIYEECADIPYLSEINQRFTSSFLTRLGINVQCHDSSSFSDIGVVNATKRLVSICQALNATSYLSGPAAKAYLIEREFNDVGIKVEWMDYPNYQSYVQNDFSYRPNVSIVDTLLCLDLDRVLSKQESLS